jgi:vacuolar protein sorting-associated protein 29
LQVFEQEGIVIGMTHGHLVMPAGDKMALEALRRRMGVDLLLTGSTGKAHTHSTHDGLLINPGSITGARVSPQATGIASFTLLVLDNGKVCITLDHVYRQLAHVCLSIY